MKIKINSVEIPEAMLDVAARSAGFSDGMRVAIGVIRKEVSQASSPETGVALEALADRMEQRWPGAWDMYADIIAEKHGWRKNDEEDAEA